MDIRDLHNIYFVCTANTCRSPLAERIMIEKLSQRGIGSVQVGSRTSSKAESNKRISPGTAAVIVDRFRDYDFICRHRSRSFTPSELELADLVIAMEPMHKNHLSNQPESYFEDKRIKVYTLGELAGQPQAHIADPFGKDYHIMKELAEHKLGGPIDAKDSIMAERYLTAEEMKRIQLASYMPTFNQISDMLDMFLDNPQIPYESMHEFFTKTLKQRFERWKERTYEKPAHQEEKSLLKKTLGLLRLPKCMSSRQASVKTQSFSLEKGWEGYDWNAWTKGPTQDRTMNYILTTDIIDLHRALRNLQRCGYPGFERIAQDYADTLGKKIYPVMDTQGYLDGKGEIDRSRFYLDIGGLIMSIADKVPSIIGLSDKNPAFYGKETGLNIAQIAEDAFPKEAVEKIYDLLLQRPQACRIARTQDEINAAYHKEKARSVTRFDRRSKAYRFTNEPMADVLQADLKVDAPILSVTASGDLNCILAGLGAKEIHSDDVTPIANAWGEYKFQAFLTMPYKEFMARIADRNATWETFPFDLDVSKDAKKIFTPLRKSKDMLVSTESIFQNQGYACAHPELVGYTEEKNYRPMQEKAQDARVLFYPTDIVSMISRERFDQGYFGLIYLSNMLDHTRDPDTKQEDFSVERMRQIMEPMVQALMQDGQFLFNIQWSNRAYGGIEGALRGFGFDLNRIPNVISGGCGFMYLASRK